MHFFNLWNRITIGDDLNNKSDLKSIKYDTEETQIRSGTFQDGVKENKVENAA